MIQWEKFLLSDLFDISTTKGLDKNKIKFENNAPYDFVGRTSVNWGIQGTLQKLDFEPNPKNSFSLVQVGESVALWREREWYASQNLFLLKPKFKEIVKNPLFIQTCINKEMTRYGKAYSRYPTMKSLNKTEISLPVLLSSTNQPIIDETRQYHKDGYIPDWKYMQERIKELEQERIKELEQERIKELEQYLIVTGLNDYELTEEDKEILATKLFDGGQLESSTSGNGCSNDRTDNCWKQAREFRVGDVLTVTQTKSVVAKANLKEGSIPYVTRTTSNNGYTSTCGNNDKVNLGNCITIGAETGVAFYQPSDFVAGNKVYRLSDDKLNEKQYMYLASLLNKQTKNYSYSNARIPEKIKQEIILLPIQTDSSNHPVIDPTHKYHPEGFMPDWDYMEKYIRAMEKVVIRDVVVWKDEMIEKTKMVVNGWF